MTTNPESTSEETTQPLTTRFNQIIQKTEEEAILLFDEADALFQKRSEVKDSHNRYASDNPTSESPTADPCPKD